MQGRGALAIAAAAAGALACAAVRHDPATERCLPDAAFERGLLDGEAGRAPDLGGLEDGCPPEAGPSLRSAYRDGHATGTAARAAAAPAAGPSSPAGDGRAFTCEVQARGESFSASGATRNEAETAARAACRERNGEAFCRETSCRRDE